MRKVLGLELTTLVGRVLYAAVSVGLLAVLYFEVPTLLYKHLGQIPSFGEQGFAYYAGLIAALTALQVIFKDKTLGDGASLASAVAQISYIFILTNGGLMSFNVASQGLSLALDFRPILYLLLLPSALLIISTVVNAAARSSAQRFQDAEQIAI